MQTHALTGIALTVLAGLASGTVLLPMKYVRGWKLENIWLIYCPLAYFVFPLIAAFTTVPGLWSVYAEAGASTVFWTALFGFGWGVSVTLFGLGYDIVGISLTSAIILGSSVAIGSLVPLLILQTGKLASGAGLTIVAADLVMLAGVLLSAWAGDMREKQQAASVRRPHDPRFRRGIAICFAAGMLSTLFNIALTNGRSIEQIAVRHGATPNNAANAVWGLAITAGYLPNLFWAVRKLRRGGTWHVYRQGSFGWNTLLCVVMAGLWISGTVEYGSATHLLGPLGTAIGWPVYMSGMIITGTFWGWVTREWHGVHGMPVRVIAVGVLLQIASIVLLGRV